MKTFKFKQFCTKHIGTPVVSLGMKQRNTASYSIFICCLIAASILMITSCEFDEAKFKPSTPSTQPASNITSTSFTAHWTPIVGADEYFLYVAYDETLSELLDDYKGVSCKNTSLKVENVNAGTQFYYGVKYTRKGVLSEKSKPQTVITQDLTKPILNDPSDINSTSFTVSWQEVPGAEHYLLSIGNSPRLDTLLDGYNDKMIKGLSHTVTSAVPQKSYYVEVKAQSSTSVSSESIAKLVNTGNLTKPVLSLVDTSKITQTTFTIEWKHLEGAKNYRLDVATDTTFTNYVWGYENLTVEKNTFTVVKLDANTEYFYRIRAQNEDYLSENSDYQSIITDSLSKPTDIIVTPINLSSFSIEWKAGDTYTTSYQLEVSDNKNFDNIVLNVSGIQETNYTFSNLDPGKNYFIRIYGLGLNSKSQPSIKSTTTEAITPPEELSINSITEFSFDVDWNYSSIIDNYIMDIATDSEFQNTLSGFSEKIAVSSPIHVEGLLPATKYYIRLKAKEGNIESSYSYTTIETSGLSHPKLYPPTEITESSFRLTFEKDPQLSIYLLDISEENTFSNILSAYNNHLLNSDSEIITGLKSGTKYYYRIRSKTRSSESPYSAIMSVETSSFPPPHNISFSEVGEFGFTTEWEDDLELESYNIDIALDSNFNNIVSGYNNLHVTESSLKITNLQPATLYYLRIRSWKGSLSSDYTQPIAIETTLSPPTGLIANEISPSSFKLSWSESTSASYHSIDISTTSDFSSLLAEYTGKIVNTNPFTCSGLPSGTTFYVRMKSFLNNSRSENSETLAVSTSELPPPTLSSIKNTTEFGFDVSFNPSANISQYLLDISEDEDFSTKVDGYNFRLINQSLFNISGLSPGTEYFVRLRYQVNNSTSPNSNTVNTTTATLLPPSAIGFSNNKAFSATISWTLPNIYTNILLTVAYDPYFNNKLLGFDQMEVTGNSFTLSKIDFKRPLYFKLETRYLSYISSATPTKEIPSAISPSCRLDKLEGNSLKEEFVYTSGKVSQINSYNSGVFQYKVDITYPYAENRPSQLIRTDALGNEHHYDLTYSNTNGKLLTARHYEKQSTWSTRKLRTYIQLDRNSNQKMIGITEIEYDNMSSPIGQIQYIFSSFDTEGRVLSVTKKEGAGTAQPYASYRYDSKLSPYALLPEAFFLVLQPRVAESRRLFPIKNNVISDTYWDYSGTPKEIEKIFIYDYNSVDLATRRGGVNYSNYFLSGCSSK